VKIYLFLFAALLLHTAGHTTVNDSLLDQLDRAILNKQYYYALKANKITAQKNKLTGNISREQEYDINQHLFNEYRKFRIDSALFYVNRNLELAELLKRPDLQHRAILQQAHLYSSTGRYLEAEKILDTIRSAELPRDLKELYFEYYYRLLEHYTTNNPNESYKRKIEIYRDSLLAILEPGTDAYKINLAQHYLYHNQPEKADFLLQQVIKTISPSHDDYAMVTYLIGDSYSNKKQYDKAEEFYTRAAIADVHNAINDHGAIQNLSIHFYYNGNIDRAYRYAKSALEDAIFCNVKFRTLIMSEFYSIINAAYQEKADRNSRQLKRYLLLISILSLFLVGAVVYVYRQMKRISRVKETLLQTGRQLENLNGQMLKANDQLKTSNDQLQESNQVKQEYIAQFFDICSSYIDKLENYRKMLSKHAVAKQFEELSRILKSTDFTSSEIQGLYRRFDLIFIHLYPGFVEEFNALLLPGERITLKEGETLNTELRIFALERLGITDSVRIAAFLRCSISTVYNYRTKARNRSAVSREEFEEQISRIGRQNNASAAG
jgi:cell division protein FtsB